MTQIQILGGGPAGLAVAYFARKLGLSCDLYEAQARLGGACTTLRIGDLHFDSGAHRLHDRDPEMTRELKALLGDRLKRVDAPSQIFVHGRMLDFPLSPLNLLRTLGPLQCAEAALSLLSGRLGATIARTEEQNFEAFAVRTYGRALAKPLLLDYSEKLWGLPTRQLSPRVAGKRLHGLDLRTLLIEAVRGPKEKTQHLDGAFYYPTGGFAHIVEALAAASDTTSFHTNARITGLRHDGRRILEVQQKEGPWTKAEEVVSSLPLGATLRALQPHPPASVMAAAAQLKFRSLVLVALRLARPQVSSNASIYCPSKSCPITRIYEPRNRCPTMAPRGQTSLVAELPCQQGDDTWEASEDALVDRVSRNLVQMNLIQEREIRQTAIHRIANAYPILEAGFEKPVQTALDYLGQFSNLHLAGRCGLFAYTHMHDMLRGGKALAESLASRLQRQAA